MLSQVRCEKCRCPIMKAAAWELEAPHTWPDYYLCWDCAMEVLDWIRANRAGLPAPLTRSGEEPRPASR